MRQLKPRKQGGAVLFSALIMLVLITLVVVASLRTSMGNIRTIHNEIARNRATMAAQDAIERTISTTTFLTSPASINSTALSVDTDNDGTANYSVDRTVSCLSNRVIKTSELDIAKTDDKVCFGSNASENAGIQGMATSGDSLCANTRWDVQGTVKDARTGARAEVHQGVDVRMDRNDAQNNCS